MQNKDWQNRLVEMEITPPANSWQKFSEQKSRFIFKRKLTTVSIATLALGIAIGGIYLLAKSEHTAITSTLSNSSLDKRTQPILSDTKPGRIEETSISKNSNGNTPPPLNNAMPLENARDCIVPIEIENNLQAPTFTSDFPYNGKVKNQIAVDSNNSPLPQYFANLNIAETITTEPLVKNETPIILNEEALFELPEIPNLCTPNGDDNNDQLCPLEKFPEGLAIGWALIKNGQVIRTFGNNECWDGNNVGGFPMDGGNYGVEIYYKSNISNPHILRKSMECLLMR